MEFLAVDTKIPACSLSGPYTSSHIAPVTGLCAEFIFTCVRSLHAVLGRCLFRTYAGASSMCCICTSANVSKQAMHTWSDSSQLHESALSPWCRVQIEAAVALGATASAATGFAGLEHLIAFHTDRCCEPTDGAANGGTPIDAAAFVQKAYGPAELATYLVLQVRLQPYHTSLTAQGVRGG